MAGTVDRLPAHGGRLHCECRELHALRRAIAGLAVVAGGLALGTSALAQSAGADADATRTVQIVVPYTPGSGPDLTARLLADKLPALLGGTFRVDNRPGASGTIGTAAVARAAPDGLTLLLAPTTHVMTAAMRKVGYDPIGDFAPIVEFSRGSFVVMVPAASPARTWPELVQLLKAGKGDLAYASAGIATPVHLFTEMLLRATDTQARHIPGKGVTGAVMDVMQSHVAFMVAPTSLAVAQMKTGKITLLAHIGKGRALQIPDVPTLAEAGLPDFEASIWLGLYAPARTPASTVLRLNRALNELLTRPDVLQFLAQNGMEPAGGTPEQFLALNKADLARFSAIAKSANITTD